MVNWVGVNMVHQPFSVTGRQGTNSYVCLPPSGTTMSLHSISQHCECDATIRKRCCNKHPAASVSVSDGSCHFTVTTFKLGSLSLSLRWTGRVTAAWWRSCRRYVRTRRATRSRTLCPVLHAPRCASAGGSARPCAPLSFHPGPSALPLSLHGPPPCRYRWSASAACRLSSAPGN